MASLKAGRLYIICATLLCFLLSPGGYGMLRHVRDSNGRLEKGDQLPDDLIMTLTVIQKPQHDAIIEFNKSSFEKFYDCLCTKSSSICTVNISKIDGPTYNYQIQSFQNESFPTNENVENTYYCEIPAFLLLVNDGGYINCTRKAMEITTCSTFHWSLAYGQCQLGQIELIWNEQQNTSWMCTTTESSLILLSPCTCNTNGTPNCNTPNSLCGPKTTTTQMQITTTSSAPQNSSISASRAQSDSTRDDAGVIGGAVSAAVVVVLLLFVIGFIIWKRKVKYKKTVPPIISTNSCNRNALFKNDNHNRSNGMYSEVDDGTLSATGTGHGLGIAPSSDVLRIKDGSRDGRSSIISSCYAVIGTDDQDNKMNNIPTPNTAINDCNNSIEHVLQNGAYSTIVTKGGLLLVNSTNNCGDKSSDDAVAGDGDVTSYSRLGDEIKNLHNPYNELLKPKENVKLRQRYPVPAGTFTSLSHDPSITSIDQRSQATDSFVNKPIEVIDVSSGNINFLNEKQETENSKISDDYTSIDDEDQLQSYAPQRSAKTAVDDYELCKVTPDNSNSTYFILQDVEDDYTLTSDGGDDTYPERLDRQDEGESVLTYQIDT